ncbi:MAG: MBOAT family O-acyltransferase [Lentisphaerota bacterium]
MVFSSSIFVFFFLPLVLLAYGSLAVLLRIGRFPSDLSFRILNGLLLIASLVFYAWGEPILVLVMIGATWVNYILGRFLGSVQDGAGNPADRKRRKWILGLAVGLNLLLLGIFKYFNFGVDNLNALLEILGLEALKVPWAITLPLGISFYTFQLMSYVIDVYRGDAPPCRSFVSFASYITMFPQLVAGPIVRYADIVPYLFKRSVSLDGFAYGVRRFVYGLGKKLLIANVVAVPADSIFGLSPEQLTAPLAWLGAFLYYLQIYFDFSGYSDMAIGMGHMFGFKFMENFNYPFRAWSLREFWRRWHISLSTWIRDYLYIPLGGNRVSPVRQLFNLFIVFVLCGLWHGPSWSYVTWGLLHGGLMVAEKMGWERFTERWVHPAIRILSTQLYVCICFLLFRTESFLQTRDMVMAMFGNGASVDISVPVSFFLTRDVLAAMTFGLLLGFPILPFIWKKVAELWRGHPLLSSVLVTWGYWGEVLCLSAVFLACSLQMASGTHNPFIYFRF